MKMKKGMALFVLLSPLLYCGCAKKYEDSAVDASKQVTNAPTVLSPTELPQPDTNYVTEEMYQNAMISEGNLGRLAAAMRKARAGEVVTVGVIGGSITQGCLASVTDNSYASRFYRWWTTAFPDAEINFINAGVGATTSYLGVHRVQTDLLDAEPDVVIVEFSVNDADTLFYKKSYDNLVRRILKSERNPAVIALLMATETGYGAQTSDLMVAFRYNLPRISYGQMVFKEVEKGSFTWDDISPDGTHPNDRGHAMVGEVLWNYLNSVYAKLDQITDNAEPLTIEPFFDEAYADAVIFDSLSLEPVQMGSFTKASVFERFPNDFTTSSGEDAIAFEIEAKNIGIIFYKMVGTKGAQFDVYVDGAFCQTLDANFPNGWGNYAETTEVYTSKETKKHTIELKKHPDSTGDVFSILGLLIS